MEAPEAGTIGGYLATIAGTLTAAFAGWRMLRAQNSNAAVSAASNDANISAIDTYKELVAELRERARLSDERADKFAEERNEAWKQVYSANGKLEAMTEQIETLNKEIGLLRAEVAQFRAQQASTS